MTMPISNPQFNTIGPAGPLTEIEEKYIHTHLVEQNLRDSGHRYK